MTYTARVAAIVRSSLDPDDERANDALDRLSAAAERRRRRATSARRSQDAQHEGLVFYRRLLGPLARCTDPDDIAVDLEEDGVGPVELHMGLRGSKAEREAAVEALRAIVARGDA